MACAKLYSRKNAKGLNSYFVRYYLPGQRDKRRQFTIGNVSSRRAKEIADRVRAMVIQGIDPNEFSKEQAETYVEDTPLKLKEITEAYLQHCSIANSANTLKLKKYSYQLLCEFLGDVNAEEITSVMIEEWMNSLDISKVSINMYFRSVRSMFYWAFANELISINPFINGKIKQFKVPDSDPEKYFSLKEIDLLLNECKSYDIELGRLVYLALETGGRISELLTLKGKDIDLDKDRVLFRGTYTKSGKNRFVPLRISAINEIRNWNIVTTKYFDQTLF